MIYFHSVQNILRDGKNCLFRRVHWSYRTTGVNMSSRGWTDIEWQVRDAIARQRALRPDGRGARRAIVSLGRDVLKQYSTSFFIVTRFLPPEKRARVDMLYAAVRYPDEVVDTFELSPSRREQKLSDWRARFEHALTLGSIREALLDGVPVILAGFVQVMRETGIPAAYYHSFLDAMHADINPRQYVSLDDLVDNYIYGSAVVVGFFLAHIYGATDFERAMQASRRLGVALQLTNFLRDVSEDSSRGRLYLPADMLRARGVEGRNFNTPGERAALAEVVAELAGIARRDYQFALANLDAFSADCRVAIDACIRVYGELNDRVSQAFSLQRRESVPLSRKLSVLPASKFWRLPLAYLGLETA